MNKASGGDGIPVEVFQILKDDAVNVLHSICEDIWEIRICHEVLCYIDHRSTLEPC